MKNVKYKSVTIRQYLVNVGKNEKYRLAVWEAFRQGYEDARLGKPFSREFSISNNCANYEDGRYIVAWARDLGIDLPPFRANDSWCPKWLEKIFDHAYQNKEATMKSIKDQLPIIPKTPVDSRPQLY